MSDCTPPTGVRWAAQDGGSEVEVKSPAGLPATPAAFWVGGGEFKEEQRFSSNGLEMRTQGE